MDRQEPRAATVGASDPPASTWQAVLSGLDTATAVHVQRSREAGMTLLDPGPHDTTRSLGDPPRPGMLWIPGGTFAMGSDDHYPEEAPVHRVTVDGFWIDRDAGHQPPVQALRRRPRAT